MEDWTDATVVISSFQTSRLFDDAEVTMTEFHQPGMKMKLLKPNLPNGIFG